MNYLHNELFIVGRLVYSQHSIVPDMQFEKEFVARYDMRAKHYI